MKVRSVKGPGVLWESYRVYAFGKENGLTGVRFIVQSQNWIPTEYSLKLLYGLRQKGGGPPSGAGLRTPDSVSLNSQILLTVLVDGVFRFQLSLTNAILSWRFDRD